MPNGLSPFSAEALQPYIDEELARMSFEDGDPSADAPALSAKEQAAKNRSSFRRLGLPAMAIGGVLDTVGTGVGLSRPGTREMNPLVDALGGGHPWGAAASSAIMKALIALALDRFMAPKTPKLANALGIGAGVTWGAVGANNFRQGQ